ncbi:Predicted DNA-binding transcriptional regulator YafY, contains an HTH and WYL domains [Fibrobacter sp. UWH9]|uniref:WYL domain-containing protein n=1 Tax=unclassified Fibrobacter TaxID=2634177 RepID=UPI00091D14F7|nr:MULTISPECIES: WYL domain-containing protein [unclassified Fibrobacter]MCQ2101277.1 WYL domain-containing protein [Fibrobacter sp.]MDO4946973.1 WYL domain-containing protein [Fibrobacter sp.]OWV07585.1 hypothetical protein B7993_01695 [Fibrobacter sp. UWH3]OWV17490.1 hypothetical protein B7992_01115 [Fibrobacter sp. UWH1]SHH02166.1 Predicted DNA-binding transcriptional regulator YafY, contains an HTH and WYL domains [Fibrobacter sp. UWH9]
MASGYEKINNIKGFLKSKVTVKQLASLLNCGPRTVFRHLDVVAKENCGLRKFKENGETYYVIQTDKEMNFNQEVVRQLEKVKKSLSVANAADLKTIKLLEKVIDSMQTTDPEDFKPDAISTDPDYILDYGPFCDNKLQDSMVNKVLKAIHDGSMIRINYTHSASSEKPETKIVNPIKVIMRMDTLYLIAADETYEETQVFKNFMFEKISNVTITNVPAPKLPFDAKIHYKYAFAKYTDSKITPEDVSLLVKTKWLQTQFERSHFFPEATRRLDKNGNMVVDVKLRITPDFVTWLMGVSTEISILKPESLKNKVRESLLKALAEMDA